MRRRGARARRSTTWLVAGVCLTGHGVLAVLLAMPGRPPPVEPPVLRLAVLPLAQADGVGAAHAPPKAASSRPNAPVRRPVPPPSPSFGEPIIAVDEPMAPGMASGGGAGKAGGGDTFFSADHRGCGREDLSLMSVNERLWCRTTGRLPPSERKGRLEAAEPGGDVRDCLVTSSGSDAQVDPQWRVHSDCESR